jgi:hypothetical protein
MAVASRLALIQAVSREDFQAVLGTAESNWLDFKDQPYRLDEPQQRWELAKDVAAFANSTGGMIVIGYRTERLENEGIERAVQVRFVPKTLVEPDRYRSVIQDWMYPRVLEMDMKWFPPEPEPRGIFVIDVPGQARGSQPFVVRRMIDEGGRETGALGIPERDGDRVVWMGAETVHHRMRPEGSALTEEEHASTADLALLAEDELRLTESMGGFEGHPYYALQTVPPIGSADRLEAFFSREGVKGALASPESLRPSGFNLRFGRDPEVLEGGLVIRSDSRVLRVLPSGFLTAIYVADREGLGWAINDKMPLDRPLRINAITLVEFTFEYFRFVYRDIVPLGFSRTPKFIVRGIRLREGNVALTPGWERGIPFPSTLASMSTATTDDLREEFSGEGDPERDAFNALERFYGLWGLGPEDVPFTEDGRVSPEKIHSA